MRVLSDSDLTQVLSLSDLLPVVEEAFVKQGRGEVERPPRPHFPISEGETTGTALVMPAAIHGASTFTTKVATVHPSNPERGFPTVRAQVHVTDAATGETRATMDGSRLTNARTGCIGGLAARELASGRAVDLAVVGAGAQARWQTRAIAAATEIERVRVYSPTPDSRTQCAADLRTEGLDAEAVDTPSKAVEDATVVVTATTATEPVFSGADLAPGTLVVAVGAYSAEMCELDATTVDRAARVFADVPEEVVETGDIAGRLSVEELIPLSEVFEGRAGRESKEEILVVDSVGSAVLDAAAAEHVLERAEAQAVGTVVEG
ncbi:ornithine cyclodeaminase [Salinigranum rubrum]|uniref:Ornithine cyclodeaminase n=1 Tax=Salinigranum rubrum TaxID=755307 RepID=A0A2I8VPA4_9EURY|nr:ornithine cyclodeaminase family protein [Salinigranum rubrum]AUV83748.1 ornithine cyclodeaminase [Salinigranum rubrum]